MSFIYSDKNLLADLIKYGQEDPRNPIPKDPYAKDPKIHPELNQPAMAVAPPTNQMKTEADISAFGLQLLDDLENVATPGEPTISTNKPGSADLIDMQLESLGSLIRFLALSEIMVNYKRIAFGKEDAQAPKDDKSYEFYSLATNAFFAAQNQDIPQFDFYINKELLKQYLVSLQATAHKDQNTFLENRLRILIGEANKNGIKVDPNYKPPVKPGEKPGEKPGDKPGEKPGTQPGSQSFDAALMQLLQLLPLSRDRIDFTRINNFLTKYNQFLATFPSPSSAISANITEGQRLIAKAIEMTTPQQSFILTSNSSMDKISFMLGADWKRKYLGFIETLKRVVTTTGSVIAQLYNNYGEGDRSEEIFKNNANQLTKLQQQASSGSSSVMDENLRDLQHLEDEGNSRLSVK
jgi:hypothetical protein